MDDIFQEAAKLATNVIEGAVSQSGKYAPELSVYTTDPYYLVRQKGVVLEVMDFLGDYISLPRLFPLLLLFWLHQRINSGIAGLNLPRRFCTAKPPRIDDWSLSRTFLLICHFLISLAVCEFLFPQYNSPRYYSFSCQSFREDITCL